jgi:hypothetical protein
MGTYSFYSYDAEGSECLLKRPPLGIMCLIELHKQQPCH